MSPRGGEAHDHTNHTRAVLSRARVRARSLSPRARSYEGTDYDLTQGPAAGPWGDPSRFDIAWDQPDQGLDKAAAMAGRFERAISMFRTSFSTVVESREAADGGAGGGGGPLAAVAWVAPYAPHASTYVPLYPGLPGAEVPRALATGSLFRVDAESLWWRAALVGNWLRAAGFAHAIGDVRAAIVAREGAVDAERLVKEAAARDAIRGGARDWAVSALAGFSDASAAAAVGAWRELFDALVARFHDGMRRAEYADSTLSVPLDKLFYPRAWLDAVGYYAPIGNALDFGPQPAPPPPLTPEPSARPSARPSTAPSRAPSPRPSRAEADDDAAAAELGAARRDRAAPSPRARDATALAAGFVATAVACFSLGLAVGRRGARSSSRGPAVLLSSTSHWPVASARISPDVATQPAATSGERASLLAVARC